MSTTKSVEDELFELLNSPDPVIPGKLTDSEGVSSSTQPISYSDPQDFLSWLDDASPTKIIPDSKPNVVTESNDVLSNLDEVVSSSTFELPPVDEKQIMGSALQTNDSIYDEMFGAIETETTNNVSTPSAPLQTQPKAVDFSEFENNVDAILSSPFPDVARLRELIDKSGYIPGHQRLCALLLLLTGSCHADEEADRFSVSPSEREFHRDLVSDTQSLIKSCFSSKEAPGVMNLEHDLIDVAILYCQRRSIDYKNIFSRLLISIFGEVNHHQSKALVSSCFYSLMSQFIPMVSLQYSELELAVDAMHTWLRLLVTYHSPTLAQHLDRVLPGWEKKAKELTSSQSSKLSSMQKASSALDSLEKELGLDLGFDDFDNDLGTGKESTTTTTASIQSAPPKSATNNGMIHSHWMTTLFAGSIPASQSSSLLDWAVFNGERYAGVYFLASLLEIHAPSLEQMNAPQLTQFFDKIATNESNWFASSTLKQTNWTDFTEAWIHATTVLINNTPTAFKQALLRTESWAVLAAEKQRRELSSQVQSLKQQSKALLAMGDDLENDNFFDTSLDDPVHGVSAPEKIAKKKKSKVKSAPFEDASLPPSTEDGDEGEDDDLMEDAQITPHSYSTMLNNSKLSDGNEDGDEEDEENEDEDDVRSNNGAEKATEVGTVGGVARRASTLLMDNLRSLTAKLSATAASAGAMGGSGSVLDALPPGPQHYPPLPPGVDAATTERYPQDVKLGVDTSCLWCDASEIIPSICGSQRRFAGNQDVSSSSTSDASSSSSSSSSSISPSVSTEDIEAQGLVRATFHHRLLHPLHRICFFLSNSLSGSTVSNSNTPWYFAIDCRSSQEKELGLFPKAYSVDPDVITDSDALSHLLAVLAPLKNTVHITIIGAGDAWHRFVYRQHHPRKYARALQRPPHQEPVELQRTLQEEHNHVHAIAVFLIKRGFRFISVVDGGFVAAVEALNRPDSRFSMRASLVDSDRATLSALLGVSNTVVGTTTERVVPTTSSGINNNPPPSSLLMSSSAAALAMSGSYAVQSHHQHQQQQNYSTSQISTSALPTSSSSSSSTHPEATRAQSNPSHPSPLSHPLAPSSSAPLDAATAGSGAASLAALSKNVGSLLSTWVTTTTTTSSTTSSTAGSAQHTSETPPTPPLTAADTTASHSNNPTGVSTATSALAGWGSSLMGKGLDTLKKGWGVTANLTAAATTHAPPPPPPPSAAVHPPHQDAHDPYVKDPSTSFIIGDNEDDDDDGHRHHKHAAIADSHAIGITRTDQERAQALALHRLAGLRKGDFIRITRDELPGAILFPCIKMKKMSVMLKKPHGEEEEHSETQLLDTAGAAAAAAVGDIDVVMVEQEIPVSRYLVITRERFIVLDTHVNPHSSSQEGASETHSGDTQQQQQKAGGVGSLAMVKSNHHLTEFIKMTFKKKDPELVTLFLLGASGESKPRQYRVVKYKDFVATLQKNMERFKI